MTITHKINMDLVSKGIAPKFDMVQGDYCARQIEFRLFSNNAPWSIPEDALVMIRYRRPDKSVGVYNTLPDGKSAYAITGSNTLAITVAPEILIIPGCVVLVVSLSNREQEISTFEVQIEVQPNLSSGPVLDGNYASVTGMLPIPDAAVSGQMLVVDEISGDGKVRTVKAGDIPKSAYELAQEGGFAGTEAEFMAQLAKGGSEALYVHITDNGDGFGTADHTAAAVLQAYSAGKAVICLLPDDEMGNLHMPVLYCQPEYGLCSFAADQIVSGHKKMIFFLAENDVQIIDFPTGSLLINISNDGNGLYSISQTPTDLMAAAMNGPLFATVTIGSKTYLLTQTSDDEVSYQLSADMDQHTQLLAHISKETCEVIVYERNHTAPNPCALTINGISYDGSTSVSLTIGADSSVPDYVKNEANRVAALVQSRQNANTITFLAGSDIHARLALSAGSYTTTQMLASAKHAAQAMEIIHKQVHLDFGAIMGDVLWDNGETPDQAMEIYRLVHEFFAPAFMGLPQFWLKGNHDYLSTAPMLSDAQVYAGISIHNTGAVTDSTHKAQGYCYRDFDEYKLRVIGLALPIDGNGYSIGSAQIAWLVNALNLSDKGSDWQTLILSHTPLDDYSWSADLWNAVTAYEGSIVANIHGHLHNYQVGVLEGTTIPKIGIPAISPYRTKDNDGNEIASAPYQKTPNTAEDTAFCVVTIDLENREIYADHYGAGVDREITLPEKPTIEEPEIPSGDYTNQIPLSTATFNGDVAYNECGYKADYRINSSSEEVEKAGMCCTGFITAKDGDVIRLKNITLEGTASSYLLLFTRAGAAKNALDVSVFGSADENGVYTYTIPVYDDNAGVGAIRLSCGNINAYSILTINEEIG